jgi:hypothetical protein
MGSPPKSKPRGAGWHYMLLALFLEQRSLASVHLTGKTELVLKIFGKALRGKSHERSVDIP